MSRFNAENFGQVIRNIEQQELNNEDIWISVGILEKMYDDDLGYIDNYFHSESNSRDLNRLWMELKEQNFRKRTTVLT